MIQNVCIERQYMYCSEFFMDRKGSFYIIDMYAKQSNVLQAIRNPVRTTGR
jgi:hypothetical protein